MLHQQANRAKHSWADFCADDEVGVPTDPWLLSDPWSEGGKRLKTTQGFDVDLTCSLRLPADSSGGDAPSGIRLLDGDCGAEEWQCGSQPCR